MRLHYSENSELLFNGHSGFTFQRNPVGQSAKTNAKPRHNRSLYQLHIMNLFTAIAMLWRTLLSSDQFAWSTWVLFCPQHTNRLSTVFMAAFQNFVKRNFYLWLQFGTDYPIMLQPVLIVYEIDVPVYSTMLKNGRLILSTKFSRNAADIAISVFIRNSAFSSINTPRSADRYIFTIPNVTADYDITDKFFFIFGIIPIIADSLLIRSVGCGVENGQFFYFDLQKIEVKPKPVVQLANVKYGIFYNGHAAYNGIFKTGWRLLTSQEFIYIQNLLGGLFSCGIHLKEPKPLRWATNARYADNSSGFTGVGAGARSELTGLFTSLKSESRIWLKYSNPYYQTSNFLLVSNMDWAPISNASPSPIMMRSGYSIRLVCDHVIEPGFVEIDNLLYVTVKIGNLTVLTENLCATHFEDGTPIPIITDNYAWISQDIAACCAPLNDNSLIRNS